MLRRTHLVISLAVALYFLPKVQNSLLFTSIVLLSTLIPDIDSGSSFLSKKWLSKPSQIISSHRGIFHSYTLCVIISLVFAFFYPLFALPVFLGYSTHLLADSFTVQGIRPFWPSKITSSGSIAPGGKKEDIIYWVFLMLSGFLFISFAI